jgi:type II secretory pathway component PulF
MATFAYEAVGLNGRPVRGVDHAATRDEAAARLEALGLTVLEMSEARSDPRIHRRFPPPEGALLEALRSIGVLLKAGLPLEGALAAAAEAADRRCRPLLLDIREAVARGSPVAESFGRHPRRFDAAAVGLIRSGERAGDLTGALEMLVSIRERTLRLRTNLLTGAIYPVILALISFLAAGMIVTVVIPRFAAMVESAGGDLPATTSLLLGVSSTLRTLAAPGGMLLVLVAGAIMFALRTPSGSIAMQGAVSRIPVLGELLKCGSAARGARIAGSLVKAGVPLVEALDAAADALGSSKQAFAFGRASADLRDGHGVGHAMSRRDFPPILSRMARTGDDAGDLGSFLIAAADTLERTYETKVRRIGIIIEPAIIIVFGALIGFVALAMFQAVYSLNGTGL